MDEDHWRLVHELLELMHVRIPAVKRKLADREEHCMRTAIQNHYHYPLLATTMALPLDMPQVHTPNHPASTPPLLSNLGAIHRDCPLLENMDQAGNQAINAPVRVFQARADFPSL